MIFFLVFASSISWGSNGNSKEGELTKSPLFFIEKSREANEVLYELNLDEKGNLDLKEPIIASWLMKTEGGEKSLCPGIKRSSDMV